MRNSGNLLLASLSEHDAATLQPYPKPSYLEHEKVLFEAGGDVTDIYFPTGAIISLVVGLSSGEIIEAAMVGKDGLVGGFAAFGSNVPVNRAIVQLAGSALTCKVGELQSAVLQSPSLLKTLFRHEQTVYAQASQSAACMAAHPVEARLCRWLLRARDLSGSDDMFFTQEFLAEMLGVRRTSVTLHARTLQQAGLIKYSRGQIHITDVEGLEETVCECYETVKTYYQALLGPQAV
ncbi:cyclic nucleotide-binding protein [Bradyrhizobium japonicum]|uniref:Cyclic nucleotide-binding protein n=1 Tax=Bradyrhizobium japonicum TaxID=375 RepID=A0A0A3Y2C5_BRAJP|nr:Crp/Fnr family transcriptional regulator [Bradyrhizobium japonicum]KGT79496.1 cyclic nucleotide-binding protein [Bradyrhizobium japonicum]